LTWLGRQIEFLMERFKLRREQVIVRDPKRFTEQMDAALAAIDRPAGFDIILDALGGM
jgi:hypothetical protein